MIPRIKVFLHWLIALWLAEIVGIAAVMMAGPCVFHWGRIALGASATVLAAAGISLLTTSGPFRRVSQ